MSKNVTVIHENEEYDVLRPVADALQERGIATPCAHTPVCASNYGDPWHLTPGKAWNDVEMVDAEVSRTVAPR